MSKQTAPDTVDFPNIDIEPPTVEIGGINPVADKIVVALNAGEYRTKKFALVEKSAKLKNLAVARRSVVSPWDTPAVAPVYKINSCVDCCPGAEESGGKVLSKALAACLASGSSCAVIVDDDDNIYVCTLNENFYFSDIGSGDDYSSKYGGLTILESGGKTRIPDPADQGKFYKINFLMTADGYPLVPVRDPEDFLEDNQSYYLAGSLDRSSAELVTNLIYVVKSGELEKYIRGVFYQGEND
ncbi:MAG TPA: hypothetical protein VN370_00845 [Desulfitobacteriaceae bacterium]|nr:hypothetical protein [Desulfitobacteriaceae bacterium]